MDRSWLARLQSPKLWLNDLRCFALLQVQPHLGPTRPCHNFQSGPQDKSPNSESSVGGGGVAVRHRAAAGLVPLERVPDPRCEYKNAQNGKQWSRSKMGQPENQTSVIRAL